MQYARQYAQKTDHAGIEMTLIGQWIDLAAYYRGSDGNAWCFQTHWVNEGPIEQFIATFPKRRRGQLFIETIKP